jgi:glutaredoxin
MKGFLCLLLIAGGVAAGWINRDKISEYLSKHSAAATEDSTAADPAASAGARSAATPNPAHEAQAKAKSLYPGLGIPNSPLNQKFLALYKEAQASNPAALARSDWPLTLAEQAVTALGGAPMPRNAATASAHSTKQVVIYTTSECPYCRQAKDYLTKKGVPFKEVNIETSLTGKEAYRKLNGNGVPLIIVGDKRLDGWNADKFDRMLL